MSCGPQVPTLVDTGPVDTTVTAAMDSGMVSVVRNHHVPHRDNSQLVIRGVHMEFTLFDPRDFRVPERKVVRVFLHNTGWDNMAFRGPDLAEEINRWHLAEGWAGIGYHYIVDKMGNIATGRPVEEEPNVLPGKRTAKTIDIAVQGLWHFTEPQLRSVQVLCKCIHDAFSLSRKSVSFHGLCEVLHVPNPMFDYGKLLHLDGDGQMGDFDPKEAKDVADRASFFVPVAGSA